MTTDKTQKSLYEDIIHLSHHVSPKRPQMSMKDRAAQFAPFAALTGHEEAVRETARLTDSKIALDENEIQLLDQKLQYLEAQAKQPVIEITYFLPDQRKSGGAYVEVQGRIKRIDRYHHCLRMEDETIIPIDDILKIDEKAGE